MVTRLERQLGEFYKNGENFNDFDPLVSRFQNDFIQGGGQVDRSFYYLLFLKPELVYSLQLSCARTLRDYRRFIRSKDPTQLSEHLFFIFHRGDKVLLPTVLPKIPAAYDHPRPKVKTVEDLDRQTLAVVHTHPSLGTVLSPSVLIEHQGQKKGDLYIFLNARSIRKESMEETRHSIFDPRFLLVTVQHDIEGNQIKILFIQEGNELDTLDEESYLDRLKSNVEGMRNASSEAEARQLLVNMGFNASYLFINAPDFFNYPPVLDPQKIDQVVRQMSLL